MEKGQTIIESLQYLATFQRSRFLIISAKSISQKLLEFKVLDEMAFLARLGINVTFIPIGLPQEKREEAERQLKNVLEGVKKNFRGHGEMKLALSQKDDLASAYSELPRKVKDFKASKIVFLTNFNGLYDQNGNLINEVSVAQLAEMIDTKKLKVTGEAKLILEATTRICKEGNQRVHIINGGKPEPLLIEIFSSQGSGTLVYRIESYEKTAMAQKDDYLKIVRFFSDEARSLRISLGNLADPLYQIAIVTLDQEIVGAIIWKELKNRVEISALAVSKEKVNSAIPRKLIEYALQKIKNGAGSKKIELRLKEESVLLGLSVNFGALGFEISKEPHKNQVLWVHQ